MAAKRSRAAIAKKAAGPKSWTAKKKKVDPYALIGPNDPQPKKKSSPPYRILQSATKAKKKK